MTRRPYNNLPDHERRRQTELNAIDDAFRDVLPWKKLACQSGLVFSTMPALTGMKRFHLTIGAWWSALIIFGAEWGDALGVDNEFVPPAAVGMLKATCPTNLDMRKIEPLIQLLGRYWLVDAKPDFDIARFIAEARASAQLQIEYRRAMLEKARLVRDVIAAKQRRGLVQIHDLGDGWMAVTIDPAIRDDLQDIVEALNSVDGVLFVEGSSGGWCEREAP